MKVKFNAEGQEFDLEKIDEVRALFAFLLGFEVDASDLRSFFENLNITVS